MRKNLGKIFKIFKGNNKTYKVYENGIEIIDENNNKEYIKERIKNKCYWKNLSSFKRIDVTIPEALTSSDGEIIKLLAEYNYSVLFDERNISEKEVRDLINNTIDIEEINDERVVVMTKIMANRLKTIMR